MLDNLVPTIIITVDVQNDLRGYSLFGREFTLAQTIPVKSEARSLENTVIVDEFWVVSKAEYMRVVPEAAKLDFDSDTVLIPVWAATFSLRPKYSKKTIAI